MSDPEQTATQQLHKVDRASFKFLALLFVLFFVLSSLSFLILFGLLLETQTKSTF